MVHCLYLFVLTDNRVSVTTVVLQQWDAIIGAILLSVDAKHTYHTQGITGRHKCIVTTRKVNSARGLYSVLIPFACTCIGQPIARIHAYLEGDVQDESPVGCDAIARMANSFYACLAGVRAKLND